MCCVLVAQSCLTLCNLTDCSPPQERILEWVSSSFSRDFPDPGIEPASPELQALVTCCCLTNETEIEQLKVTIIYKWALLESQGKFKYGLSIK